MPTGKWTPLELINGWESVPHFPAPEYLMTESFLDLRGHAFGGEGPIAQIEGWAGGASVVYRHGFRGAIERWAIDDDGIVSVVEEEIMDSFADETEVPPTLPGWVGDAPVIEDITFGHGSFGKRCRLCSQDDYLGPIVHLPGCPADDNRDGEI